ncbi:MAG TPA: hypothetical protein VGJ20_42380 [Xanthobacteraceae bacterium]
MSGLIEAIMHQLGKTLWINIVPLAALFILLAMIVQASAQPLSCSDQITELRHNQPTPKMGTLRATSN